MKTKKKTSRSIRGQRLFCFHNDFNSNLTLN
nr:MAG TPA: hypothetical protein [Caudoviricetes sp.]